MFNFSIHNDVCENMLHLVVMCILYIQAKSQTSAWLERERRMLNRRQTLYTIQLLFTQELLKKTYMKWMRMNTEATSDQSLLFHHSKFSLFHQIWKSYVMVTNRMPATIEKKVIDCLVLFYQNDDNILRRLCTSSPTTL